MTAYWMTTYREIRDEERLAAYAALAKPAIEASGGRFLARGLPAAVHESGRETRSVLIEFPSLDDALAAYDSAGYREALDALGDGADRDLRIVPGS